LNPLYEAYNAYCEKWQREQAEREREAAERGAGKLAVADKAERKDTRQGRRTEKKKDGRSPCDIAVLLGIVLYGAMEHIYSSRAPAKARGQNINFMWLLQGNPPPSHGMINAFRKHLLRERCTASKKPVACREASRANIAGEEGILLRANRPIQAEGALRGYQRGQPFQTVYDPWERRGKGRTVSALLWL
jgi:hypothetical protein